jgi:hypothetical protein
MPLAEKIARLAALARSAAAEDESASRARAYGRMVHGVAPAPAPASGGMRLHEARIRASARPPRGGGERE